MYPIYRHIGMLYEYVPHELHVRDNVMHTKCHTYMHNKHNTIFLCV